MADGELFAAMHDVGLAEFVAKRGGVPGFDPVAPFPGPESSYATPRRATCLGIYGNLRTTSTTFSSCAGRLASLGESRHTAFFLDLCERGITNIDDSNQTRCLDTPVTRTILAF